MVRVWIEGKEPNLISHYFGWLKVSRVSVGKRKNLSKLNFREKTYQLTRIPLPGFIAFGRLLLTDDFIRPFDAIQEEILVEFLLFGT